jgi:purine-binding chemotaxis protein CheW
MARRSPRAARQSADARYAETGAAARIAADIDAHLMVFRIADGRFAFRLEEAWEIVRLPSLARMPLAPRSLLGLANLRGIVLPVVSLRRLLGVADAPFDEATRVIVTDRGAPVGFVVDRIEDLLTLPASQIEKDDAGAGSVDPDVLDGVVKGGEGDSTIKILNSHRLLHDEFAQLDVSGSRSVTRVSVSAARVAPTAEEPRRQVSLLSFHLGQQEYALPLDRVREIIPLPFQVSELAGCETAVLGVVTLRDRLLPLVSLRALLGLPSDPHRGERGKVVVLSIGNGTVGMVADRTREILHVDPSLVDPAPALLTRGGGDAEVTSICRLDDGKRLVALLSPDRLFRSELVRRLVSEQSNGAHISESPAEGNAMADEQFIIFRLGEQEYGLPVGAVDEIARPPDQIARLPKAPAFIEGVINLRGDVVPIIDLRRRFELTTEEPGTGRRILVLSVGSGKAGFLVDGVSEVMKVPSATIRSAPELSPEQMRLIGRVANVEAEGRMILLIDPTQLLDRVEDEVLAKFDRTVLEQASPGRDQTSHRR